MQLSPSYETAATSMDKEIQLLCRQIRECVLDASTVTSPLIRAEWNLQKNFPKEGKLALPSLNSYPKMLLLQTWAS